MKTLNDNLIVKCIVFGFGLLILIGLLNQDVPNIDTSIIITENNNIIYVERCR